MRFIVKPAGIIAVAVALAGLAYLSLRPLSGNGKSGDAAAKPIKLNNANFELSYKKYQRTAAKGDKNRAQVSGNLAMGWSDSSEGADLTVRYSDDKDKPHGGATCQRIEIGSVAKGTAQFGQSFTATPGTMYRGTLWVRASERTEVTLGLRREGSDPSYFEQIHLPVVKDWRLIEVIGTVDEPRAALVLTANQPGITLWVDDARVEPALSGKK